MTDGHVSIQMGGAVELGARLRQLSDELKAAGRGDLARRMRRNIRRAATPVEADLRRAAMSVHVTSSKGGHVRPDRDTGLRRRVAGAITTSVTARGVRIKVDARRVDPNAKYGASLPKYLDATLPRNQVWRHRVFGRDVWVAQRGQPWFFVTITGHERDFRQAILLAWDETARELAK